MIDASEVQKRYKDKVLHKAKGLKGNASTNDLLKFFDPPRPYSLLKTQFPAQSVPRGLCSALVFVFKRAGKKAQISSIKNTFSCRYNIKKTKLFGEKNLHSKNYNI